MTLLAFGIFGTCLPTDGGPWYKWRHFILLNPAMMTPALSSATNGFDGSLLNGLQSISNDKRISTPQQGHNWAHQPMGLFLVKSSPYSLFRSGITYTVRNLDLEATFEQLWNLPHPMFQALTSAIPLSIT